MDGKGTIWYKVSKRTISMTARNRKDVPYYLRLTNMIFRIQREGLDFVAELLRFAFGISCWTRY